MDCGIDLRRRCDKAVELMLTPRTPLHQLVNQVLEVFNELTLDCCQVENEKIMLRHFAQVNAVFGKYDIRSPEDYKNMSSRDLYSILFVVRAMIEKLELPGQPYENTGQ